MTELPQGRAAERSIVIAAMDRSGSTLLCEALAATGRLGKPAEFLQPTALLREVDQSKLAILTSRARRRRLLRGALGRAVGPKLSDLTVAELRTKLADAIAATSTDGVFAMDLHWTNYRNLVRVHDFDLLTWIPQPVTWILLRRQDLVAAAVSLAKARRTQVWHVRPGDGPSHRPAEYADEAVLRAFAQSVESFVGWSELFEVKGIDPIVVWYEELDAAYSDTVTRILAELLDDPPSVPPPTLTRTSNAVDVDWATRFRAQHPALVAEAEALVAAGR